VTNPYAAPTAPLEGAASKAPAPSFRSPLRLARGLALVLAALIATEALGAIQAVITGLTARRLGGGLAARAAGRAAVDPRSVLVAGAALGLAILAAVLFCWFVARAHGNARAFEAGPFEFTAGWAAASFFVPLLNLYKPYRAVKEIWQASAARPTANAPWWFGAVPPLLPWWWGAYLLYGGFAGVAAHRKAGVMTAEDLAAASGFGAVASVTAIVAGLLAIRVVLTLARLQEERAALVDPMGPSA
jgi:hypothetical protein